MGKRERMIERGKEGDKKIERWDKIKIMERREGKGEKKDNGKERG